MPAIIGGFVKVVNMSTGGVATFGDALAITPKTASKAHFGSGESCTGDFAFSHNMVSNTNVSDVDVVDNSIKSQA